MYDVASFRHMQKLQLQPIELTELQTTELVQVVGRVDGNRSDQTW